MQLSLSLSALWSPPSIFNIFWIVAATTEYFPNFCGRLNWRLWVCSPSLLLLFLLCSSFCCSSLFLFCPPVTFIVFNISLSLHPSPVNSSFLLSSYHFPLSASNSHFVKFQSPRLFASFSLLVVPSVPLFFLGIRPLELTLFPFEFEKVSNKNSNSLENVLILSKCSLSWLMSHILCPHHISSCRLELLLYLSTIQFL